VGVVDGTVVGRMEGNMVGDDDGRTVGKSEGASEATWVGDAEIDGAALIEGIGDSVGV